MELAGFPFTVVDWAQVEAEERTAEAGTVTWRQRRFGDVRVRRVEYGPGYVADHWCDKGHVLYVLRGELVTELDDGRVVVLRAGQSYQVADGAERHRSSAPAGAELFVVD